MINISSYGQGKYLSYGSKVLLYDNIAVTFNLNAKTYEVSKFTYSEADMGEANISLDLLLPADVDAKFSLDWNIMFMGEKFTLNTLSPPGLKDTSSLKIKYTLNFISKRKDLKFVEFLDIVDLGEGNLMSRSYDFSFQGNLTEFIDRYQLNLNYYFKGAWRIVNRSTIPTDTERVLVTVKNTNMWDLLTNVYELYGVRWRIANEDGIMTIIIGELPVEIEHIFEYGPDKGLTSIERANPTEDIYTRLRGKGGNTNLPRSYFKTGDPDANDLLKTAVYEGVMPTSYREYVRGWNAGKASSSLPSTASYAFKEGYNDATSGKKLMPIDWVQSDTVDKWGIRYGSISPNTDIYPTIQGMSQPNLGRVDEIIAVEEVVNDDWESAGEESGTVISVPTVSPSVTFVKGDTNSRSNNRITEKFQIYDDKSYITLRVGYYAVDQNGYSYPGLVSDVWKSTIIMLFKDGASLPEKLIQARDLSETTFTIKDIPAGKYELRCSIAGQYTGNTYDSVNLSADFSEIKVYNPSDTSGFKKTFDIWIKDIGFDLRDQQYWVDEDMAVMFSDGMLTGEDREFTIVADELEYGRKEPRIYDDETKTYNGVKSRYRITLKKNDSELQASDMYLPNKNIKAVPGDHFFLINIKLPQVYIEAAEQRVQDWMEAELSKVDDEFPTYVVKPSPIFCAQFAERDKIRAGAKMRVRNERLIGESYLPIYIQSLTLTYSESSTLPTWDIVISDNVISSRNPIQLLQGQINAIGGGYGSNQQIAAILKNLEKYFLRKDGIADTSYSPTTFNEQIKTKYWRQGTFAGAGASIYQDANGAFVVEADKGIFRRSIETNELIVNQITVFGGKYIYSPANMEVTRVEELNNGTENVYRCYFDTKQGTKRNQFAVQDQAYSQRFDPSLTQIIKYYWRLVVGIGDDYIDLSINVKDGDGIPMAGDVIATLGNRTNPDRQSAIVIDVVRAGGGLMTWLDDISEFNLNEKDSVEVGRIDGKTWVQAYGNAYIGERDRSTYMKHENGVTEFKGTATFTGGPAKDDVDDLKEGLLKAESEVSNLENYLNGAFADGIVSEAEAVAIEKYLNTITVTNQEVTSTYSNLYGNPYLDTIGKSELYTAYRNYSNASSSLTSVINSVIADGLVTGSEKTQVNNAFTSVGTRISEFYKSVEVANRRIQDAINANADQAGQDASNALEEAERASELANQAGVAANNASQVANIANAKPTTWYKAGSTPPYPPAQAVRTNDLWVDGYVIRRYNGGGSASNINYWVYVTEYDNTPTVISKGLITTGALAVGTVAGNTGGIAGSGDVRIWSGGTVGTNAVPTGKPTFRVLKDGAVYSANSFNVEDGNGNVNAGFTSVGTTGDSTRLWCGATFANKDNASFRVTHDGSVHATRGKIGGFTITDTTLTYNNMTLGGDVINFKSANTRAALGNNTASSILGRDIPFTAENTTSSEWDTNTAAFFNAKNAFVNEAIHAVGDINIDGSVRDYKMVSFTPSSKNNTLPLRQGTKFSVASSSYSTVYFPTKSEIYTACGISSGNKNLMVRISVCMPTTNGVQLNLFPPDGATLLGGHGSPIDSYPLPPGRMLEFILVTYLDGRYLIYSSR
ncbi:hypothetical protein PF672P2_00005 [Parabacteroides phage PF672P2]|nr:hypothetical protein PF672P2_00005 [Parabacteroides phage PF672P2]